MGPQHSAASEATAGAHRRSQLHRHFFKHQHAVDGQPGQDRALLGPAGGQAGPAARLQLPGLLPGLLAHGGLAGCWVRLLHAVAIFIVTIYKLGPWPYAYAG